MKREQFMRKVTYQFNYTFEQAGQLWDIAEACFGMAAAVGGTTGAVLSVSSGTVSVGVLTLPGWAVGFLGGFIAGEIACLAGGAKLKQAFDALLEPAS